MSQLAHHLLLWSQKYLRSLHAVHIPGKLNRAADELSHKPALRGEPFDPLQSVELKILSFKTLLLTALAMVKRVGDLQAFSVDNSCLEFSAS